MPAPTDAAGFVRFGSFEVDLRAGELRKSARRVRLEGQPFQILVLLLERPGQVVTRDELKQKLWPADTFVDFEHGINTAVKRLREALGDSADTPRFIETLPRRGYRFICPLDGAAAAFPQPVRWWRWAAGLLVLLAFVVGMLALDVGGYRARFSGDNPAINSLAVLPLDNLTGDPGLDYFADGLTDELTTVLARIKTLRVPSRTSAMTYKGKRQPLREIADELKVEAVVEGSVVRVEGDVWTINVQLIHALTDRHLWAHSYQRDRKDLSKLSADVARDIIAEARVPITPEEQTHVLRSRPTVSQAYEAYLKGDYYYRKRTREDLYKGMDYFRQAIDADPTYAAAYDGLATTYWLLCAYSHLSPHEAYPKAKAAALKAIELDDALGTAHATLGRVLLVYDLDWQGAERQFQRARQLESAWPLASFHLMARGRPEEAIRAAQEAVERDPLSPSTSQILAWAYMLGGRYDKSIAQLQKTLELDPGRYHAYDLLARNYASKKMYSEAITACAKALDLLGERDDPVVFSDCGWVYGVAGRRAEALKMEQKLTRPASPRWVDPLFRARIQIGLGNKDSAIQLLFEAYDARSSDLVLVKESEIFGKEMATDARFQELLRRIGVPQ